MMTLHSLIAEQLPHDLAGIVAEYVLFRDWRLVMDAVIERFRSNITPLTSDFDSLLDSATRSYVPAHQSMRVPNMISNINFPKSIGNLAREMTPKDVRVAEFNNKKWSREVSRLRREARNGRVGYNIPFDFPKRHKNRHGITENELVLSKSRLRDITRTRRHDRT